MENQTRFDLSAALENSRIELGAQPSLSADERRELETHLRDTFGELKSRGLSEEEAFWLARRRVGQPQQLAEEFIKADPAKIWRNRIFLFATVLWCLSLWSRASGIFMEILAACFPGLRPWLIHMPYSGITYHIFYFSPILCLIILLASNRVPKILTEMPTNVAKRLILSRNLFAFVLVALTLVFEFCNEVAASPGYLTSNPIYLVMFTVFYQSTWSLFYVGVATWLLPVQSRPNLKIA